MEASVIRISPPGWLESTLSEKRLEQPDILLGILPLIVLLNNVKPCNLNKRPISGGISL